MQDLVFKAGQCWRSVDGTIYRVNPDGADPHGFQYWDRGWSAGSCCGRRPHTPCPDPSPRPQPRSAPEAILWAFQNPGRALVFTKGDEMGDYIVYMIRSDDTVTHPDEGLRYLTRGDNDEPALPSLWLDAELVPAEGTW